MLIANQISITLALLVGTFLVVRAEQHILKPKLAYDPNRLVVVTADFSSAGYTGFAQRTFYEQLVERIRDVPGVDAVALSSAPPFQGVERTPVTGAGEETIFAWSREVSPAYFPLTAVRLLRGRLVASPSSAQPGAPVPVVVSESLARVLSGDTDVVGQRVRLGAQRTGEIVGVVADVASVQPGELDGPMLYQSIDLGNRRPASVVARVAGDPRLVIAESEALVRGVDATVQVTSETIAATIAREAAQYNSIVVLSTASSGLAVCLSFVGLFGMMMFATAQRTKEISIRLAIGAGRAQIVGLFMRLLVRPLIAGLTTGVAMAVLIAVLLRQSFVLLAVNAADPWPYGFAITLVIATVVGATLMPAVIAARMEPSTYLRQD